MKTLYTILFLFAAALCTAQDRLHPLKQSVKIPDTTFVVLLEEPRQEPDACCCEFYYKYYPNEFSGGHFDIVDSTLIVDEIVAGSSADISAMYERLANCGGTLTIRKWQNQSDFWVYSIVPGSFAQSGGTIMLDMNLISQGSASHVRREFYCFEFDFAQCSKEANKDAYRATIIQNNTSNPTTFVKEDNTGLSIGFTRTGVGTYSIDGLTTIDPDSVFIVIGSINRAITTSVRPLIYVENNNTLNTFSDAGTFEDGNLCCTIEIYIYR